MSFELMIITIIYQHWCNDWKQWRLELSLGSQSKTVGNSEVVFLRRWQRGSR